MGELVVVQRLARGPSPSSGSAGSRAAGRTRAAGAGGARRGPRPGRAARRRVLPAGRRPDGRRWGWCSWPDLRYPHRPSEARTASGSRQDAVPGLKIAQTLRVSEYRRAAGRRGRRVSAPVRLPSWPSPPRSSRCAATSAAPWRRCCSCWPWSWPPWPGAGRRRWPSACSPPWRTTSCSCGRTGTSRSTPPRTGSPSPSSPSWPWPWGRSSRASTPAGPRPSAAGPRSSSCRPSCAPRSTSGPAWPPRPGGCPSSRR